MKLETWLERRKMSGREFAHRLGLSPSQMQRIIRGKTSPSREVVLAITEATDDSVRATDLFE
jgi:transcriptional regulator with XRE-family HTH domain